MKRDRQPARHGYARPGHIHPVHRIWREMWQRCTNPNNPRYASYGARGIQVCQRWSKFEDFLADIGERPSGMGVGGRSIYSLDRIDNNVGYEPGNVKWSTAREQSERTTRSRLIEFRGETMVLTRAERLGITHIALHRRLQNWSLEDALTKPANSTRRKS